MVPTTAPLIGFSGEIIWPLGQLSLLVKIGDEEHLTSAWMNFMVVRSLSPYNRIIGRPGVRKIQIVLSTTHEMLKLPVAGGILTLRSSNIILIECVAVSRLEGQPPAAHQAVEERITEGCPPARQKRRSQAVDRNQAIQEEHDGSWRMRVDFTELNKTCPKDGYPLPEIDWKVESLCGFPFKFFLDAYKG
ncbi:hypothetical protein Tco_1399702 [Tanacetum coccineum]